jgi:hypothetical protein
MEALLDYSHQTLYTFISTSMVSSLFFEGKFGQKLKEVENFATISYNTKEYLRFILFFFNFFYITKFVLKDLFNLQFSKNSKWCVSNI